MPNFFKIIFFILLYFINVFYIKCQDSQTHNEYVESLREKGTEPIQFVLNILETHDLILFDDANHSTSEPFKFCQQLIKNTSFQNKVRYIFIEVFSLSKQSCINSYLNSENEDRSLLYPAFQDDFSGFGWTYETYFDLMHTIYLVNKSLPVDKKFKVICVSSPTYWSSIISSEDVKYFRRSLVSFDYTMYMTILNSLDEFHSNKKGIFLTNTRHAYKGIKDSNGNFYWNCGTFFNQWYPGKTYSIRFHNAALYIENEITNPGKPKTTEGMENIRYKWVRIANGLWDDAFLEYKNQPVAITLKNTPFGSEKYVGNHMLDVLEGQTMYNAYDAIIFLAPLEELHRSALTDEFYTDSFKKELERRMRILYTPDELENILKNDSVSNIQMYIEKEFKSEPEILLPQAQDAIKEK